MASPALRYVGQGVFYLILGAALGYFSDSPAYTHFPPDQALIKLALAHVGQPKQPCRRLSREELEKLAPNMRRPTRCERERLPVVVELVIDGAVVYHASLPPTGLAKDGPSRVYERIAVTPGRHELVARLRDSHRSEGFDYEAREEVELRPQQSFAIDFRAEMGGFVFH